jgi:hypothetical protein
MKVRHITKRKVCAWEMMRGVSGFVLKDMKRRGAPLSPSQKKRLRYRAFWK